MSRGLGEIFPAVGVDGLAQPEWFAAALVAAPSSTSKTSRNRRPKI